jgi:hypothetical protein
MAPFDILKSRISNGAWMKPLRPQDIVVVLKLIGEGKRRPTYAQLASDLSMSPSQVHASIRRARAAKLLLGPDLGDKPNLHALDEIWLHSFP